LAAAGEQIEATEQEKEHYEYKYGNGDSGTDVARTWFSVIDNDSFFLVHLSSLIGCCIHEYTRTGYINL
jgi:hypothetical protein